MENKDKLIYFLAGAGIAYAYTCYRQQRHGMRAMRAMRGPPHQPSGYSYPGIPMQGQPMAHPRQRGLMAAAQAQAPMLPPPNQAPMRNPVPNSHDMVQTPYSPNVPGSVPQPVQMQQQDQGYTMISQQGGSEGALYETFELAPGIGPVELQGF